MVSSRGFAGLAAAARPADAAGRCQRCALASPVTHVRDGDTIEVAGVPVRLQGLAAPERNEPGGPEATAAVRALVGGRALRCELEGTRANDRCAGVCYLDGAADVGAELVWRGTVRGSPAGGPGRPPSTPR